MSNLLKEAIVDAKALRDAALKTAESTIVEKYSDEVRKTLENILEQDDFGGLAPPAEPVGLDMGADLGDDSDVDSCTHALCMRVATNRADAPPNIIRPASISPFWRSV